MKRTALFLVIVAVTAPAAWGQTISAERMLTGVWKCEATADGMTVRSSTTYLTGGKETFDVAVKGDAQGMPIEFTGKGTGDWKFLPDGKMQETITGIKIASGKINGQDVLGPTLQPMIEPTLANQVSTSTVTIEDKAMTLVDQNGVTTTCSR